MALYTIAKECDERKFKEICTLLETKLHKLQKDRAMVDVDGSLIQVYRQNQKKIRVFNDYEVGAVYIDSEIDLSNIL